MLHKASTIDELHGTQLKRPTALMLKEGCQPRCGASTQVSWAWHLDWLQAAVCAVLFRPALPTQLSCHFAAQQQNEFCIFLFASRATPSAASVAPEMILPAAAAAPLLLTRHGKGPTPDCVSQCMGPLCWTRQCARLSCGVSQTDPPLCADQSGAPGGESAHYSCPSTPVRASKIRQMLPCLNECTARVHCSSLSDTVLSKSLLYMRSPGCRAHSHCMSAHAWQLSRLHRQGCKDPEGTNNRCGVAG